MHCKYALRVQAHDVRPADGWAKKRAKDRRRAGEAGEGEKWREKAGGARMQLDEAVYMNKMRQSILLNET